MADVRVTVEPPLENQIVEVSYDGQEIIQPPLTQAEHLSRQVNLPKTGFFPTFSNILMHFRHQNWTFPQFPTT